MKVYVSHSRDFDFKKDLYLPLRGSRLNDEHEIALPHENEKERFDSKDVIRKADLVVAEASYPSTGSGIELGWADTLNVPIILLCKKEARPSASLKTISEYIIFYSSPEDMVERLSEFISDLQKKPL